MFGTEFWTNGTGFPGTSARDAMRLERDGFDGMVLPDSQNLTGDPYVELAFAAAATTRIKLGTGVTNSLTRHPAVTATAIATLHEESRGRAVLGIGRGDSALAHLGLAPDPVRSFERYLSRVQGYLAQDEVAFDVALDGADSVRSSDSLRLAGGPTASRIKWLKYAAQGKTPVHVVASGPKVIEVAARHADGIVFAVGASGARLQWAIDVARSAREAAGLDPDELLLGAMIPIGVHEDRTRAQHLIQGTLGSYVRFSVMHGTVNGPASDSQRGSLLDVHSRYDMNSHARRGPQADAVTDEVLSDFSITGSVDECVDRLCGLRDRGVSKFLLHLGAPANLKAEDPDGAASSYADIVERVLPAVRG
jgi:5,10-methylenetetrahydromethanopterin reductase